MSAKLGTQLSMQLCAVLVLSSCILAIAVVEGTGAVEAEAFDEEFMQSFLPETESVGVKDGRLPEEGHFQLASSQAKETQLLETSPWLWEEGSTPSEQTMGRRMRVQLEMVQKIQRDAAALVKGNIPEVVQGEKPATANIKHQMARQMASYRVRLAGLKTQMASTAKAIHTHQQIIAVHRARIARLNHSLHKKTKHAAQGAHAKLKVPETQLMLSSKRLRLGKIINSAVAKAVAAHVTAQAHTRHAEMHALKSTRSSKALRRKLQRKAKPEARRFIKYPALTVPGKATVTSKRMMSAIDKAVLAINRAVPTETAAAKKKMRQNIREEVNAEVATKIAEMRALKLPSGTERAKVKFFIKTAVIKAVTAQVADRARKLAQKNLLTPNNGNQYVEQESVSSAAAAMRAAKAQGKNNRQVRYAAKVAANTAAQVALRQVAQATARSAAMRAAQAEANAGGNPLKQRVAAQIAARAAMRFVIHKKRMLRYLAKVKPEVIPYAPDIYAPATKAGAMAARNAQEASDAAKMAQSSDWPTRRQEVASRALATPTTTSSPAPKSSTATKAKAKAKKNGKKANTGKTGNKALKSGSATKRANAKKRAAAAVPYKARVAARTAAIRASAAVTRANAAAEAARQAPPGKAGAKIIAKARLIAAEAAKDVADARMANQVAKSGVGPKPIIHQAASQAASIATPIATEVASQTASIQATIAAVKATKKLLARQQTASAGAIKAAHRTEALADHSLKGTIHKRIRTAVSQAVKTAVKAALKLGKRGKHLKAVALAAARKAALLAVKQVKSRGLRKEVRRASRVGGHRVAAAAKAAGGNAEQVASLGTETRSTLRMDGADAINADVKRALAHARAVAMQAASGALKRISAQKASQKKQAKSAIKRAIKKAAGGSRGASSLLKRAQAELKRL